MRNIFFTALAAVAFVALPASVFAAPATSKKAASRSTKLATKKANRSTLALASRVQSPQTLDPQSNSVASTAPAPLKPTTITPWTAPAIWTSPVVWITASTARTPDVQTVPMSVVTPDAPAPQAVQVEDVDAHSIVKATESNVVIIPGGAPQIPDSEANAPRTPPTKKQKPVSKK